MVSVQHRWKLVAPWYRWEQADIPASGRDSVPVFQKFASDNFVNDFLKHPQHSLKFDDEEDQVYRVDPIQAPSVGDKLKNKLATFLPLNDQGKPFVPQSDDNYYKSSLTPTGRLKIYLPTHGRHYLVVCELHCDAPGFPRVDRAQVCQAGFVVRRRQIEFSNTLRKEAASLLKDLALIQAKIADLDQTSPLRPRAAKKRAERIEKLKLAGRLQSLREELDREFKQKQEVLQDWKIRKGIKTELQGWFRSDQEQIGQWQTVEETPENIMEASLPLFSVYADPSDTHHDAYGSTLYFGVLPTVSADTDAYGKVRFDDSSVYEVRCFVRRHNPHCPLRLESPDCNGELVWSEPTEPYQLASPFDLQGTANRPVTIKMPDLRELAAQAANSSKFPSGKFAPVKFIQPQTLKPEVDGKVLADGSMEGLSICFFSIPLITLVALFVLNLFLPIVVILFRLWFLLAFKFCISSNKLSLDVGDLNATLDALLPRVDLEADFEAKVEADDFTVDIKDPITQTTKTIDVETVNKNLNNLADPLTAATGGVSSKVKEKLEELSNLPLLNLGGRLKSTSSLTTNVDDDPPVGMDLNANLEFETPQKRKETRA